MLINVNKIGFNYRDTPVLVEWKTSTQPKPSLQRCYDGPLQLAAYLGAMHCDPNYAGLSKVRRGMGGGVLCGAWWVLCEVAECCVV